MDTTTAGITLRRLRQPRTDGPLAVREPSRTHPAVLLHEMLPTPPSAHRTRTVASDHVERDSTVRAGRRWLAFDADFFFNPFVARMNAQFGPAGVLVFTAFLCACKRSTVPGTFTYTNEPEALVLLGLADVELVDPKGQPFTLGDVWKVTGTLKQTKKTRISGRWKITATHWERWQKDLRREEDAQRKAVKRSGHVADTPQTHGGPNRGRFADREDSRRRPPLPPQGGPGCAPHGVNGHDQPLADFVGIKDAAAELRATMQGRAE